MGGARAPDADIDERVSGQDRSAALHVPTILILTALAYAAVAHGAFYARELVVVVLVTGVALAISARDTRFTKTDLGVPAVAAGALAAWYVVAGSVARHPTGALPALGLCFAMVAAVTVVRRADRSERELFLTALLAIGAVVAFVGWVGVAWRWSPRAIADGGLWRAASTITYANVTGALTGALGLVALGRLATRPRSRLVALLAFALVVGAGATASRGTCIGFAAGLVVLVAMERTRALRAMAPVLIGAAIAITALLPSMPATHHADPVSALLGLAAGGAVALTRARTALVLGLLIVLVLVLVPAPRNAALDAWRPIRDGRFTTSSPDRSHEFHAALDLARRHPIAGVGPGRVDLHWQITFYVTFGFHIHYAHDEYLQTWVEAGVIGLLIAAAGIAAVATAVWKSRGSRDVVAFSGVVAALLALAVQSATDFLWHVPIVPLTAAALVALALSRRLSAP